MVTKLPDTKLMSCLWVLALASTVCQNTNYSDLNCVLVKAHAGLIAGPINVP